MPILEVQYRPSELAIIDGVPVLPPRSEFVQVINGEFGKVPDVPRYSPQPGFQWENQTESNYDYIGDLKSQLPSPSMSSGHLNSEKHPDFNATQNSDNFDENKSEGCRIRYFCKLTILNCSLLLLICSSFLFLHTYFQERTCQDGWKKFEKTGFCYKAISDRPSNFNQAHQHCQYLNSHLVSIHSEEENEFVAGHLSRNSETVHQDASILGSNQEVWIGLMYVNGQWEWSDGSKVRYSNWATHEPNDLGTETKVTLMTSKISWYNPNGTLWNNIAEGSYQRAFVCKKGAS